MVSGAIPLVASNAWGLLAPAPVRSAVAVGVRSGVLPPTRCEVLRSGAEAGLIRTSGFAEAVQEGVPPTLGLGDRGREDAYHRATAIGAGQSDRQAAAVEGKVLEGAVLAKGPASPAIGRAPPAILRVLE